MLGAEVQNRTGDYSEHVNTITNDAGGNGGIGGFEANLSWVNCEFANSYSGFLDLGPNASNYLIENCYFHNKPRGGGAITNGRVLKGTTIKQSTFHTIGYGGLGKVGVKHAQKGGESVVEFNRIYDYHFHGDDSGIQINRGNVIGITLNNNWIYDMPGRNGIRFDGDPAGIGGIAHHNVSFDNRRGFRFKGDQHTLLNNLAFNNSAYDIGTSHDKFYGYLDGYDPATDGLDIDGNVYDFRAPGRRGSAEKHGNEHSIIHNNAGNDNTWVPVLKEENKTGNSRQRERNTPIENELRDINNFDFRPIEGSLLIDKGTHVEGFTEAFVGNAPDIGAYEYGSLNYWIPGHKTEKARSPIPYDKSPKVKSDTDLMWLEGLNAISHNIYFGVEPGNLELVSEKQTKIHQY